MKTLLYILLFLVASSASAAERQRVLLVVANESFDLRELAIAHQIFERNGFINDIASPSGGAARAKKVERSSAEVDAFSAEHAAKLSRTMTTTAVDPERYAAVFLVGGSGAMLEFPSDEVLREKISAFAKRGGVIGAVCHGAAALVDVKLANGRYLIEGKRLTAFTEEEEARFGAENAASYPFVLERALRDRGARFEEAGLMLVQVSRDGLLVTGQNPFSTARTAEEMIVALGQEPKRRELPADEATMLLIDEMSRNPAARAKLDAAPGKYDPQLVARYGALLLDAVNDAAAARRAVLLLEGGGRYFKHPKVESALARAQLLLARFESDDHGHSEAAPAADRRRE